MSRIKILMSAGCLLAGLVPATAHHGSEAETSAYLAFWGAFDAPPVATDLIAGSCRDGEAWKRGFVSIFSQGSL